MTTQQLQNNISVRWNGYGSYDVTMYFYNKKYTCQSHNSIAYDRIKVSEGYNDKTSVYGYTYKQALQAFWNECKLLNNIV